MITQIEIDGFKTFQDFKVELAPFQVIVGPNSSGKSNLFDALQLLSALAETDLYSAFQRVRGPGELFTKYADGSFSDRIRIAVELLLDRKIRDTSGADVEEIVHRRWRYEVEIAQGVNSQGLEELYVEQEALKAIPLENDLWCKKYAPQLLTEAPSLSVPQDNFFFSFKDKHLRTNHGLPSEIIIKEDGSILDSSIKRAISRINNYALHYTVLSSKFFSLTVHLFAVRLALQSLKIFHFNPEALRKPSSVNASPFLASDGSNLPATLARMQTEDKYALTDVSLYLANLSSGIGKIRVEKDPARNLYDLWAETTDKRTLSAEVLSDGTLRLLALATLCNDPRLSGIICLEEPENGVHPLRLQNMARVLREMATNFNDPEQADEPLRQILITTHSPAFISQPPVIDSLLFAVTALGTEKNRTAPMKITTMASVITPSTPRLPEDISKKDKAEEFYTIAMVKQYLDSQELDHARDRLNEAHSQL